MNSNSNKGEQYDVTVEEQNALITYLIAFLNVDLGQPHVTTKWPSRDPAWTCSLNESELQGLFKNYDAPGNESTKTIYYNRFPFLLIKAQLPWKDARVHQGEHYAYIQYVNVYMSWLSGIPVDNKPLPEPDPEWRSYGHLESLSHFLPLLAFSQKEDSQSLREMIASQLYEAGVDLQAVILE